MLVLEVGLFRWLLSYLYWMGDSGEFQELASHYDCATVIHAYGMFLCTGITLPCGYKAIIL